MDYLLTVLYMYKRATKLDINLRTTNLTRIYFYMLLFQVYNYNLQFGLGLLLRSHVPQLFPQNLSTWILGNSFDEVYSSL